MKLFNKFNCRNKERSVYTRIYFRDMNHLRESLKDLLGPNVIASYNSNKKGRRE